MKHHHHISKRAARQRRIKRAKHLRQFRRPDYSQWKTSRSNHRAQTAGLMNFIFNRLRPPAPQPKEQQDAQIP